MTCIVLEGVIGVGKPALTRVLGEVRGRGPTRSAGRARVYLDGTVDAHYRIGVCGVLVDAL